MAIQKLATKFATGAWLPNVKEYFKKINELIDWINGDAAAGSGSYKSYVALITQTSTNPPSAIIVQNTTDLTFNWVYVSAGLYTCTITGAFTVGKTGCFISNNAFGFIVAYPNDVNTIRIATRDTSAVDADDILNGTLEIRIYN